jgi:hypothetical protein
MSTPTPAEPTAATVVADVHAALDTANQDITDVLSTVEHLDFGTVAAEAKQVVHDLFQVGKDRIEALFGHPTVPTQTPPTA